MDMLFISFYEEFDLKGRAALFTSKLYADDLVQEIVSLELWCGGSDLHKERFVDYDAYWLMNIDLGICFRQHQEE